MVKEMREELTDKQAEGLLELDAWKYRWGARCSWWLISSIMGLHISRKGEGRRVVRNPKNEIAR